MTNLTNDQEMCILCGAASSQITLRSGCFSTGMTMLDGGPFGGGNLDLFWRMNIHKCPGCGYCDETIDDSGQGPIPPARIVKIRETVASDEYRKILVDETLPEFARHFMCASKVRERSSRSGIAGFYALAAAWVCDNESAEQAARACRLEALRLFLSRSTAPRGMAAPGEHHTTIVDTMRRAGLFRDASRMANKALKSRIPEHVKTEMQYELYLCETEDARIHFSIDAVVWSRSHAKAES